MAESSLPYLNAYSNITKVLEKIREAETPTRFSQDYLATTLQMPGGSAKPVIPFLKRIGFLASDGMPTELYKRFRGAQSGAAAAEALRIGYKPVYRINEFAHDATDTKHQLVGDPEELDGVGLCDRDHRIRCSLRLRKIASKTATSEVAGKCKLIV